MEILPILLLTSSPPPPHLPLLPRCCKFLLVPLHSSLSSKEKQLVFSKPRYLSPPPHLLLTFSSPSPHLLLTFSSPSPPPHPPPGHPPRPHLLPPTPQGRPEEQRDLDGRRRTRPAAPPRQPGPLPSKPVTPLLTLHLIMPFSRLSQDKHFLQKQACKAPRCDRLNVQ